MSLSYILKPGHLKTARLRLRALATCWDMSGEDMPTEHFRNDAGLRNKARNDLLSIIEPGLWCGIFLHRSVEDAYAQAALYIGCVFHPEATDDKRTGYRF
jgi:hypothetical protein